MFWVGFNVPQWNKQKKEARIECCLTYHSGFWSRYNLKTLQARRQQKKREEEEECEKVYQTRIVGVQNDEWMNERGGEGEEKMFENQTTKCELQLLQMTSSKLNHDKLQNIRKKQKSRLRQRQKKKGETKIERDWRSLRNKSWIENAFELCRR